MRIILLSGKGEQGAPCSVALGMFDGVHMGHRRIISAAKNISTELGISTAVLIFSSSPRGASMLLPLEDRLNELKNAGADIAYVYDFDELRNMSAEDFVNEELCKKLGARGLAAGYNYRFGKGGAGDGALLLSLAEKNGIKACICEQVSSLGEPVSSTRIRALLGAGEIESANALLTYPYYINEPVIHGKALGRELGIPTINQRFSPNRTVLACGIYYTKTTVDGRDYISVTNVGKRPTVENGGETNLETHVLGFSGDLYGKTVRVTFFGKGRGEMRFDSVEALRREIMLDCERAKKFFGIKE